MIKTLIAVVPLLAANIDLNDVASAAGSSGGCGGERGPQGPAGPRGPEGPAGYSAVSFNEGSLTVVPQMSQASPVTLASVTVTAAEQGKVLLTASGYCTFSLGQEQNTATIAI